MEKENIAENGKERETKIRGYVAQARPRTSPM